jgi:hypothetical protein
VKWIQLTHDADSDKPPGCEATELFS